MIDCSAGPPDTGILPCCPEGENAFFVDNSSASTNYLLSCRVCDKLGKKMPLLGEAGGFVPASRFTGGCLNG